MIIGFVWVMILIAATFVAYEIGELNGEYQTRKSLPKPVEREIENPKPICICGHGINFHKQDGKCDETIAWEMRRISFFNEVFDHRDKCRCLQYTGPEPVPSFYHPLELEGNRAPAIGNGYNPHLG